MEALVIIDVQMDYFTGGKKELKNTDSCLKVVLKWEQKFLSQEKPVIYIQHIGSATAPFFAKYTTGINIHPDLSFSKGDIVVKTEPDSFQKTNLESLLKSLGVNNITICGMMTHMCVDTTVRSAYEKGYKVAVISDGIATCDLTFNGATVDAADVNTAYLAALQRFATIL